MFDFYFTNELTSVRPGMELCAPIFVTDNAAALQANAVAANTSFPSAIPTAKAPLKTSPAAVVSIADTG